MSEYRLGYQWRRLVMQAVLWLILAATVALAVLVTYQKRRGLRLPLDGPRSYGLLRVSAPRHWTVSGSESGDSFKAVEPQSEGGRRLTIARMPTAGWVAPLEHLLLNRTLSEEDLAPGIGRGQPPRIEPLQVAGWPGTLVTQTINLDSHRGQVAKELIACAVLPDNHAVVIELIGPGAGDAADDQLVRQMAENVAVVNQPFPADSPSQVQLGTTDKAAAPIRVGLPPYFRLLGADDPNRMSRDLLLDSSSSWTSVELIGCLFFPEDGPQTMQTLLSARSRAYRDAEIRQLAPRLWQADFPEARNFPTRAYLLANGEDQALLAIFHGGYHDSSSFEPAWNALAATCRFPVRGDLAEMLRNGALQAQALAQIGLDSAYGSAGRQQWLLWNQRENSAQFLWMQLWWPLTPDANDAAWPCTGLRLIYPPDPYAPFGARPAFERHWLANHDGSSYQSAQYELQVDEHGNAVGGRKSIISRLELEDGRLRTVWPQTNAPPRVPPSQFVPGCFLPALLGKLSDTPMILRTESFVGCDGAALPELLTLLIWHDPDAPAKPDETGQPMQCLSVSVNGTGRISRWYYDRDGNLRYIDLADGLRAHQDPINH